ncbi:MAG: M14 family metallopeptidase [Candidatus Aminicenantes bacterium]|jgi:hypothetical protein
MRKRSLFFLILILFLTQSGTSEIASLSEIFHLGKGIRDLDNDNLGDKVALNIILPDTPSPYEIAAAGDIAARANLESLVVDFSLVKKESEVKDMLSLENAVLIGPHLEWIKKMKKAGRIDYPPLEHSQGLVSLLSYKDKRFVILTAGSEKALLATGRAFFLRWPYLWEIWGREQGATYFSVEKDLVRFLDETGVKPEKIIFKSALYEFPEVEQIPQPLKKLRFNSGEIKDLTVEIHLSEKQQKEKTLQALESLRLRHLKGQNTDILTYPGCRQITFTLHHKDDMSEAQLFRMGFPKRMLTPSHKTPSRTRISGKDFDLLELFSSKGFYSDSDNDRILDTIDTSLIIPHDSDILGAIPFASRLVLDTAGASFPLIYLDKEIEEKKSLKAPILIGQKNSLNEELIKKGKLKVPDLEESWGMAKVVPQAFNKSNALAIAAADNTGLKKILSYLSRSFPYLDEHTAGHPRIHDVPSDIEKFLKGEKGSSEAYFNQKLKTVAEETRGREFESFTVELYLPQKNTPFEEDTRKLFEEVLQTDNLDIKSFELKEGKTIFEKEKEFTWEGDEGLTLIQECIGKIQESEVPVKIQLGVSESPEVRVRLKSQIQGLLKQNDIPEFEVKVFCAYKQGFFWLLEEILPSLKEKDVNRLVIRFEEERENLKKLKRFYAEPSRWLQELYPVDDVISQEINLPLERIEFEMKNDEGPIYEVLAFDEKNEECFRETFSPRVREAPFLRVLPEWGTVKLTTGWLKIERGNEIVLDTSIKTDLERFWDYYQDEVLPSVYSHVMKKTGNEPTFDKQPYFKRLLAEMWFSEPDYRLGMDEEIISSLEAMHDEIYFDTLDFLRGITEVEIEEKEALEDTSRYSAPGNIFPLIHPSSEGGKGKVKFIFEDWQARTPQVIVRWEEKGREPFTKKIAFPSIKAKTLRIPTLIYNGKEERIENLFIDIEFEKEAEYMTLIDLIDSFRGLLQQENVQPFSYPKLKTITLRIKFKELEKEESLSIFIKNQERKKEPLIPPEDRAIVPTDRIISHTMCLDVVERLSRLKSIHSYVAGRSYEDRKIPVLEIYSPLEQYTSLARLITCKPTIYLSARQHANEVSSTNYVLKFAELVAKNPPYQEFAKKMNIVIHPMENPDGTELAYALQKLTPFHSLHAGRYSSLGMDVGYQVNASKPLLPEAKVRRYLYDRWLPDIYLNLHGYPSHEWVQQFSNYSPYLFRDYWIPRGWFAYFRSLSLPIYEKWKEAGEELMKFITEEIQANERFHTSNQKFYNRYFRWASRWQPHMDLLELHDGVNLYAKRRSSRESRLSPRRQITFVEETPELMDETAHGDWLDFLCEQGLTYLRAHAKYLSQAQFEILRLEEEGQDRVQIRFIRSRPGKIKNNN